jgi:hypothetical protein
MTNPVSRVRLVVRYDELLDTVLTSVFFSTWSVPDRLQIYTNPPVQYTLENTIISSVLL